MHVHIRVHACACVYTCVHMYTRHTMSESHKSYSNHRPHAEEAFSNDLLRGGAHTDVGRVPLPRSDHHMGPSDSNLPASLLGRKKRRGPGELGGESVRLASHARRPPAYLLTVTSVPATNPPWETLSPVRAGTLAGDLRV